MTDVQPQVQEAIDELVESGAERGAQVAAYRGSELVVDAVAGVADPATGRLVEAGTPFYNYSIGKGMTSTIAHLLAERGAVTYDTRIADVWPEFAAHGKDAVTLRHVLTHTAGVPGIPVDATLEDITTWESICAAIADEELWWEPGTKAGYHAYSFGFIVGEVVRRITGDPISTVLLDEVATPLGMVGELWFGMPLAEQSRLAVLEDAPADPGAGDPWADLPPDLPMFRAGPMTLMPTAALGNDPTMLAADVPAGGKTSARAIARMYAALLGNVDGVTFVSPERLRELSAVAFSGPDEVFGNDASWALGYAMGRPGDWNDSGFFGMAGAGGSWAGADPSRGVAIGITKNVVSGDFATAERIMKMITG